jgi:hypothetical protein
MNPYLLAFLPSFLPSFLVFHSQHIAERSKALDALEQSVRAVSVEGDLAAVKGALGDAERTRGYTWALRLLDWDWQRATLKQQEQQQQQEKEEEEKAQQEKQKQKKNRELDDDDEDDDDGEDKDDEEGRSSQKQEQADSEGGADADLRRRLGWLVFGSSDAAGGKAKDGDESYASAAAALVKQCADRGRRAQLLQALQEGRSGEVEIVESDGEAAVAAAAGSGGGGQGGGGGRFDAVCALFAGLLNECDAQRDCRHAKQLMILSDTIYTPAPPPPPPPPLPPPPVNASADGDAANNNASADASATTDMAATMTERRHVQESLTEHPLWSRRWFWEDVMLSGVTEQLELCPQDCPWEDLSYSPERFATEGSSSLSSSSSSASSSPFSQQRRSIRAASFTAAAAVTSGDSSSAGARGRRSVGQPSAAAAAAEAAEEEDELHDAVLRVHNTVFAQLAAIVQNMAQFGRGAPEIAAFLDKMCRRSQLADGEVRALHKLLRGRFEKQRRLSAGAGGGVGAAAGKSPAVAAEAAARRKLAEGKISQEEYEHIRRMSRALRNETDASGLPLESSDILVDGGEMDDAAAAAAVNSDSGASASVAPASPSPAAAPAMKGEGEGEGDGEGGDTVDTQPRSSDLDLL